MEPGTNQFPAAGNEHGWAAGQARTSLIPELQDAALPCGNSLGNTEVEEVTGTAVSRARRR